jgi:selenocysteine lyase/cysteine desulfurase
MLHYDLAATTRASFYVYNGLDDVSRLADALDATRRVFASA